MTHPDRRIPVGSVLNMRDLGGLPLAEGRVAPGRVYRSGSLAELSDADAETFTERGIATVYDLRTAGEREAAPDRLPAAAELRPLDVLADSPAAAAANIPVLLSDPAALAEALGHGKGAEMLTASYRDIVRLPSALASYRSFFLSLADEERAGAALFHCSAGKDRTGWAAAALLTLLGASEDVIRADYLQTNEDFVPALQPVLDQAAAAGIDPELLLPVIRVEEAYLEAALDEARTQFGSLPGYFSTGLGLDTATQDAVRARFVA